MSPYQRLYMSRYFEFATKIGNCEFEKIFEKDRNAIADFLASYSEPLHRDGKPLSQKMAAAKVDSFIRNWRFDNQGYIIRHQKRLIGLWTIEKGLDRATIMVTCRLAEPYRKKGITLAAWRWTVEKIFRPAQQTITFHVASLIPSSLKHCFCSDFYDRLPFEMGKIQAVIHPQDNMTRRKVEREGFKAVRNIIVKDFKTKEHDGTRIIYEINIGDLLELCKK